MLVAPDQVYFRKIAKNSASDATKYLIMFDATFADGVNVCKCRCIRVSMCDLFVLCVCVCTCNTLTYDLP